jgi:two-component system, cell cycle response regulator DivK
MAIKLLVVEDDEMSRDMVSRRLIRLGYVVITASNGSEAVEVARTQKPDLILMDMCLPGMDGVEATKQIKTDAKCARIPIIALTALNTAVDLRRAIQAGCNDYETKPVAIGRLHMKIRKLLPAVDLRT